MKQIIYKKHKCVQTNLIPVRGGGHRVLCSECYTTSSYDQEDGHFEVPEVHYIMTHSTHSEGERAYRSLKLCTEGVMYNRVRLELNSIIRLK